MPTELVEQKYTPAEARYLNKFMGFEAIKPDQIEGPDEPEPEEPPAPAAAKEAPPPDRIAQLNNDRRELNDRITQLSKFWGPGGIERAQQSDDPLAMIAATNWPTLKSQLIRQCEGITDAIQALHRQAANNRRLAENEAAKQRRAAEIDEFNQERETKRKKYLGIF